VRSTVMMWSVPLCFTMRSVLTAPWSRVARWQNPYGQLDSRAYRDYAFLGDVSQVQLTRWVSSPGLFPCFWAARVPQASVTMSRLLFAQDELGRDQVEDEKDRKHHQVEPKIVEA